jgi:hypothetical protein
MGKQDGYSSFRDARFRTRFCRLPSLSQLSDGGKSKVSSRGYIPCSLLQGRQIELRNWRSTIYAEVMMEGKNAAGRLQKKRRRVNLRQKGAHLVTNHLTNQEKLMTSKPSVPSGGDAPLHPEEIRRELPSYGHDDKEDNRGTAQGTDLLD